MKKAKKKAKAGQRQPVAESGARKKTKKKAAGRAAAGAARQSASRAAYHHGDLRNTLLQAAEELLEEGGIEALSLRDAARRAGVSHAAPYRHFPAKIDLLYALAERGFQALDEAMRTAGASSPDAIEQLEAAGFSYVRLAVRHPWRTRLMFGGLSPMQENAPPGLAHVARSSFEGLFQIIVHGQSQAAFVEQEPLQLALSAWALVHGTAMLVIGGQFRGSASRPTDDELRAIMRVVHRTNVLGMLRDEQRAQAAAALPLSDWIPGVGPVNQRK